jgi:predicted O-methyltransferase YrrM
MAVALNVEEQEVRDLFDEIENDGVFREQLNSKLRPRSDRNPVARYGRRVGWYAAVRKFKPRMVIESGVHDGLGSSILLRALERNQSEGFNGVLIGIDVDPAAGWLVPDKLRPQFQLVIADSLAALSRLEPTRTVDLFIHDSLHQYDHEIAEYRAIEPALSQHGILLSDNAHSKSALQDYAATRGRTFHFCVEHSRGHFYPGAGIGISL